MDYENEKEDLIVQIQETQKEDIEDKMLEAPLTPEEEALRKL